jgi:very-short-patch-repair endonuclease
MLFSCDNRSMAKHFPHQDEKLRGKLRIVARQMRHEPTLAENLLWHRLRAFRLSGYKFRRQYAIDRFIVDFYCPGTGLIIEVDGEVHRQQVEADQEREQVLTGLGFRVIRFTNAQVLGQTDQVLQQILDALEGTPSPKSGFDDFGEGDGG